MFPPSQKTQCTVAYLAGTSRKSWSSDPRGNGWPLRGIAVSYPVEVYGTATFYAQFRLKPMGKKTVTVCQGTACHVMGGAQVLDEIRNRLGIEPGDTTEDGMFTLETVACIGACALAPTMVMDGNTLGTVKSQDVKDVLNAAREA